MSRRFLFVSLGILALGLASPLAENATAQGGGVVSAVFNTSSNRFAALNSDGSLWYSNPLFNPSSPADYPWTHGGSILGTSGGASGTPSPAPTPFHVFLTSSSRFAAMNSPGDVWYSDGGFDPSNPEGYPWTFGGNIFAGPTSVPLHNAPTWGKIKAEVGR